MTLTADACAPLPVRTRERLPAAGGAPLVSCIMPTRNRRRFVSQAISYFLRQDYKPRELVIVDDGEDRVQDLVPNDDRFTYVALGERHSIGSKRNIACEASRGELIAHWDDDDWQAPDRLSRQVVALTAGAADACGPAELLHYAPMRGEAWLYRPQAEDRAWIAGCALLYRKSAWASNRFPDSSSGEDAAFVSRLPTTALRTIEGDEVCVAVVHGANAAVKSFGDRRWSRVPLDRVSRLVADDRAFYVRLRNGWSGAVVPPVRAQTSISVAASFVVYEGYGVMAEYLVRGMARAGATVNPIPLDMDPAGLSDELLGLIRSSRPEPGSPVIYNSWPRPDLERFAGRRELFINTMWESSRLPGGWASALNQARAVIVPSRFVADACRSSGVTAPIEVVPEGVDPAVYRYQDRPEREGLTTLIVGTVVARKHVREGIAAWKAAFVDDPAARLVIKARFGYGNYTPDDPRITLVDADEPSRGIAHWYRAADVLLALGNEGFGLPLVEGMATGLPVIALTSEGQGDVCQEVPHLVLGVNPQSWESPNEPPFGRPGVRGVPGVSDVCDRLRWVASHRDEARDLGRAASAWVRANRDVWLKGPAVLDVLEAHVSPPRPLRRTRTMWVPGSGAPCGVAEYSAYLTASLTGALRLVSTAPAAASLRLLHVQHAPGLVNDSDMVRIVTAAKQAHAPVVVTEHLVNAHAAAWERDADVLIALTAEGTRHLRRRWPGKDVRHIAHGCPTWFPPRKRKRGRVIGAFGFLGRHKGFWNLLEAIRQIPGSELLIISHAQSPELEQSWQAAVGGLPVRRIAEFLPIEYVARRLAAEADVLAYWYDAAPHASASGAVRIGLASGVPVLTSRTGWFDGLADVAFQPDDLVEGIRTLLDDAPLRERLVDAARAYCHEHAWARTAQRHLALWESLDAA